MAKHKELWHKLGCIFIALVLTCSVVALLSCGSGGTKDKTSTPTATTTPSPIATPTPTPTQDTHIIAEPTPTPTPTPEVTHYIYSPLEYYLAYLETDKNGDINDTPLDREVFVSGTLDSHLNSGCQPLPSDSVAILRQQYGTRPGDTVIVEGKIGNLGFTDVYHTTLNHISLNGVPCVSWPVIFYIRCDLDMNWNYSDNQAEKIGNALQQYVDKNTPTVIRIKGTIKSDIKMDDCVILSIASTE